MLSRVIMAMGVCLAMANYNSANEKESKAAPQALSYVMKSLAGKSVDLKQYAGKVILMVNVASECGLTPQYEGLQKLFRDYQDKGLVVLGFPCNQFGEQEPGSSQEIRSFCTKEYGVTFDMFEKVEVNGAGACELYKYLTSVDTAPKGKGKVNWNFEKFLLNRQGEVVGRFDSQITPEDAELVSAIEKELTAK